MTIRQWARERADRVNERSDWRTYSKRKRILAAAGLSIEMIIFATGITWLVGTLGIGVIMGIGVVWFVAMMTCFALMPERAPGWFVVYGTPLEVIAVFVALALTESLR